MHTGPYYACGLPTPRTLPHRFAKGAGDIVLPLAFSFPASLFFFFFFPLSYRANVGSVRVWASKRQHLDKKNPGGTLVGR
ncbi:hypothetical protein CPSG_01255 [Coccidioides posadasii str. Silveira]|uniref:Uncharacterized protein n=1 Tax=Coccidioides posadasii (strain RMSCC 757 / Silveira) TaxID=443226 RepID=E9CS35_COCPS|nr:hypothetical protein CPSG_01255 [Coccidioides posadasii str. Silveira]